MPETLLISSAPSDWRALSDITFPRFKHYADMHGYGFFPWVSDPKDYWFNPATRTRELLPVKGFAKLDLFLRFLPEYERVVWLDADMVITNFESDLDDLTWQAPHQLVIGHDHNGHNTTVIIARSSDLMFDFMWACNNTGRKLFLGHDWVEMEAMRYFLQTPPYDDQMFATWISCKRLCPILHTEYVDAGLPAKVSQKYGWEEGDWSVHLSALHISRRVELAKQFAERFPCPQG